jgi:serine/threonine protein kinase
MKTLNGPIQVLAQFEGGGLGQLLHCRDAQGLEFAAKFPKDLTPENQALIHDEQRRFIRHQGKNVVCYYGPVVHSDGRQGFAMELMEGSLSGLVAKAGLLTQARALAYFAQVVDGLAEVHGSAPGAFHGDLKLANVLYRGDTAKLADFGLARGGLGQTMHLGKHNGGTPGYLPPEGVASPKGDVYSLGVMLWAMLAGREPSPQGPHFTITPGPALTALLRSMLQPDPRVRPDIREVQRQLVAMRQQPAAAAPPAPSQRSSLGLGDLLIGGALVAGGVALLSAIFGGGKEWDPSVGRYRGPDGRFMPD